MILKTLEFWLLPASFRLVLCRQQVLSSKHTSNEVWINSQGYNLIKQINFDKRCTVINQSLKNIYIDWIDHWMVMPSQILPHIEELLEYLCKHKMENINLSVDKRNRNPSITDKHAIWICHGVNFLYVKSI